MSYSKRDVVFLDIKGMTTQTLCGLGEFLRINMITPISRSEVFHGAHVGEKEAASFSGGFTEVDATRVEEWLHEHSVVYEEPRG